jgi:hypothetical protein
VSVSQKSHEIYYFLVEVDNDVKVVKAQVAQGDVPARVLKEEFCHLLTKGSCTVLGEYKEADFAEKKPYLHVVVKCHGEVMRDDLIFLLSEDEAKTIEREIAEENRDCRVVADILYYSRLEYDLISYFKRRNGLSTSDAIKKAEFVLEKPVITVKRGLKNLSFF